MGNNRQKPLQSDRENNATRRTQFYARIKAAIRDTSHATLHSLSPDYKYQPDPQNDQEREKTLITYLASQSAEIHQLTSKHDILEKTASLMAEKKLGSEILIGDNEFIQALNGPQNSPVSLKIYDGNNKGVMNYTMTTALAAASETGTLFFASSRQNPAALNFLPTCHIALLDADTIFQTYEQVYDYGAKYRAESEEVIPSSEGIFPPRSLNMISGPSRTADIEQALTLGAHGPIELIVLIYNSKAVPPSQR